MQAGHGEKRLKLKSGRFRLVIFLVHHDTILSVRR